MYTKEIAELFKVVITDSPVGEWNTSNILNGYVTNFRLTSSQASVLNELYSPIPVNTLFSVEERTKGDIQDLLAKQFLHYIEVYGLNSPGLFDLEANDGTIVNIAYVRGITIDEFKEMLATLMAANAPIKDVPTLAAIIKYFAFSFDVNLIRNNELRIALFDESKDVFNNGDDFIRWCIFKASGSTLLIKSTRIIEELKKFKANADVLNNHMPYLAEVFFRHKPLILALKNKKNARVINKIRRLANRAHRPIYEGKNKTYLARALRGESVNHELFLFSLRDKMKILNQIEFHASKPEYSSYFIRNGKLWVDRYDKKFESNILNSIRFDILDSMKHDLDHLRGKNIIMDDNIAYGLPVSRKQTIGNLPFGTTVKMIDNISAGIYWKNSGGATDLDLSAVDLEGKRVGWGQMSGYSDTDIIYSGDVTDARNGAMEFMTSKSSFERPYGLFVNIFNGRIGAEAEVVVGTKTSDRWMDEVLIREKIKLDSRANVIGFVKGGVYRAYQSRIGGARYSGSGEKAAAERGKIEFWTIKELLEYFGIEYLTEVKEGLDIDYDLRYKSFSYDKLEKMLKLN
jgi:hypothetical protein